MRDNQSFDKFKSKLIFEAILNSVMTSLSVGFSAGGLVSLICWLCGYKSGIWVALGIGAGIAVIAFPLFYFFKFRPTQVQTGRRVDNLGLQERAVTMLDYMDDQSYMATRQRIDATSHIIATSATAMKITVPVLTTVVFSASMVFGGSFGVVSALYRYEVVDSPTAIVDEYKDYIEVTYIAEEGGEIEGKTDQILENPGDNAETVTAVAMDGYMFVGWDDGNKNPTRTDLNVTEHLTVTAQFEAIDSDPDGEQGDFEGPGNEGDSASDQPAGDDESQGGKGDDGDGQGAPGDSEGSGSGDQEGEGKGDGQGEGAGGKWGESNYIKDGQTYYRDELDEYYYQAMLELSSLDDLPPELRAFIEAYYESV